MSLSLRTASALDEPALAGLIDACFERVGRESALARALAAGDPHFDPGLSLIGEVGGRAAGYALFLPRRIQIRGAWVRLAVASPFATLPEARKQGLGHFLLRTGFQALRDRGIRGMVALGPSAFFGRHGFAAAFNLYTTEIRLADLPEPDSTAWRGLRGDDLATLRELMHRNYAGAAGTEERSVAALDWESPLESGHTLVLERDGAPKAYLHFRTRGELEVRECAGESTRDIHALLAFLARLMREHGRMRLDLHVPPTHPIARVLFHRGCPIVSSNFRGASMLCVLDWPGLIADSAPHWLRALERVGVTSCSLGIDGVDHRLDRTAAGLVVGNGRVLGWHFDVPAGHAQALLTGQRCWQDVVASRDDAATRGDDTHQDVAPRADELGHELFPGGTPMWSYSPVFGLADE